MNFSSMSKEVHLGRKCPLCHKTFFQLPQWHIVALRMNWWFDFLFLSNLGNGLEIPFRHEKRVDI